MKRCNKCKSERVEEVGVDETYEFEGFEVRVHGVPASRCEDCGEQTFGVLAVKASEEAAAMQLARTSIVTGETFRFMRKVLGLAAKEVAEIFDVSAETVSRWERGERPVDRAAWIVIAETMRQVPAERAETLERLRGLPRRPAATYFDVEVPGSGALETRELIARGLSHRGEKVPEPPSARPSEKARGGRHAGKRPH